MTTATERLIEHRNATLDLFRRLAAARSAASKPIPESIARSHHNLDQNRFILAIVGKVKAGKSTFINALLRKELLPTDALQATAAIIEIFHAEKPFLRLTYANGATEETHPANGGDDLSLLCEKLREFASIQPEIRDLPLAQLNDLIIERYNLETGQAEWEPEILDLFFESDLPNIHKIPKAELISRSKSYLEQFRDGSRVAMRIEVGYPTAYQLDHFRIVDTPGICAKGGFAERTLEFLINADAVIYLHKDEPAEETLDDALHNVIPEKAKSHMLLVLTHKSQRIKSANDAFLIEAQKCCPQISRDRIFIVDSLTEIALQSLYGLRSIEEILDQCANNEEWETCIARAHMAAKNNPSKFIDILEEQSNMRNLRSEILRMSEKSLGIQIATVLSAIEELYADLEEEASARADAYKQHLKDPQQFAAEMTHQVNEMNEIEAAAEKRIRILKRDYDLANPRKTFGKRLESIVSNAVAEINGKEFGTGDTAKTADDFLVKIAHDVDDELEKLIDDLRADLRDAISDMESSLQDEFEITVPRVPLTDILSQLRDEATETVSRTVNREDFLGRCLRIVTFGYAGKKTETVKKLDATKYFTSSTSKVCEGLVDKKMKLAKSVRASIDKTGTEYMKSVGAKLDDRRNLFERLKARKVKNDAVQQSYEEESAQAESARQAIAECVKIRNDL
jgi:hypothetical protein